ncbi:AMP-binding protein [Kitasatospora sp. HPMI-4]|uniref:AMP-binding protein n=1 Tax=Kitasatospora sp. HPMI-4 TaxID=3448443 RepID=UPI003F194E76
MIGNPIPEARTAALVHQVLDEATAEAAPGAVAVGDRAGRWTYSELSEYSHAVDAWLESCGVGLGDRVLVQLPSTRELVALFYGTARRGAVLVPLNPGMKEYHLRSVLANAEPRLVIATDAAAAGIGGISPVPVLGFGELWPEVSALRNAAARASTAEVDPDDVAVLVYTSGSTAAPKGVICPHRQMVFASEAINRELGYRPDDVVFCRFPISWDYGLYKILLAALGRSELVLADGDSDLVLLKRIRESGATVVPIVPSLAAMICALAERDPAPESSKVRMFTNTGAALPKTTVDALRTAFPGAEVIRQFGQTECKRISVLPPEFEDSKPTSVGRPLPGTRVLILDEAGMELPIGETGEIVVEGPHVMPGYWRAPELTAKAFRTDPVSGQRRLHTGDFGSMDEDGFLYYEGRRDDMFKRKGVRMSTIEIEAAAMDIPGVQAAAVLPPSEDRDLAVCVVGDLPPHTVLRELSLRLEPAKVPGLCQTVDELPLTLHGKHDRRKLATLFEGTTP